MPLFGLLNYEDYILNLIARSDQTHNGLMVFIICVITSIIRFHLSILFCWLTYKDSNLDYITPIIITIILSMMSNLLYQYVATHRPFFESWTDYFINNYNTNNFIRWKRKLMFLSLCYVLVAALLVKIDNEMIIITVIQTFISFGICDLIDNNIPKRLYDRIYDYFYVPFQVKFYPGLEEVEVKRVETLTVHTNQFPIIEDYGQNIELFDDSNLTISEELDTDLDKELRSIVEDLRTDKIVKRDSTVPNIIPVRQRPIVKTIYEPTDVKAYLDDYISPMQDFFGNVKESFTNIINDRGSLISEIPAKPRTPPRVTKGSRF